MVGWVCGKEHSDLGDTKTKFPFSDLVIYGLFFFWSHTASCRTLVPQPCVDPMMVAAEGRGPNPWTTKEFPLTSDLGGEGNGTPLQYSCLENPMDGGAWWAAVNGVAKSRTRLSDFTFTFHFSLSCIGEGNGNPLQCSCLENPRDRGAWWAAVYGVTQSRTRLKQLSSSSSSS